MLRTNASAALLAVLTTGCFFGGNDGYGGSDGTLVVDWTVSGSKARAACRDSGADAISIAISTERGRLVDELQEPCELFEVGIDLRPGTYVVDVVLLDSNGFAITTSVSDLSYVYSAEASVSAFDFPPDSFF